MLSRTRAPQRMPRPKTLHLVHLDMLRGIAAVVVVVGHIRGFLLLDYANATQGSILVLPFYLLGGMGHQAVIAFFALSGFLVGGGALRIIQAGNWSFPQYLVVRLARLWTVVIPALILTWALDVAGQALGGGLGYTGVYYGMLSSGPSIVNPIDHSLFAFFSNMAFLQTITVPVYGSNGPLWSLAYEFWYYIIIPLAAYGLLAPGSLHLRVSAMTAALLVALLLPNEITVLGLIWLCGALGARMMSVPKWNKIFGSPLYIFLAIGSVLALVGAGVRFRGIGFDLVLGLFWAATLPALAAIRGFGGLYTRVAHALSEISFTLYATHFPLLALIYFCFIAPRQWPPGGHAILIGGVMLLAALLLAWAMWWCFERNTMIVRAVGLRLLRVRS
jgi:peptidoglycan/LPS O-acetylase OafA/YrhL